MSLTTVYLYNKYSGDEEIGVPNDRLESLIEDVSDLVEKKCGRTFGTATYKEWLDGTGGNILFLPQYPIIKIKKVASSTHNAINIEASGFDTATVSSNVSAIVLDSISAIGDEVSNEFYYTTYANVASMVTAMDATDGWTATEITAPSNESSLMRYSRPIYAQDALGGIVQVELANSNDWFKVASESNNSIYGLFPYGKSNIYVEWDAGYTLPSDNDQHSALSTDGDLPSGLIHIVNRIISRTIDEIAMDTNMSSEKLADYGYSKDGIMSSIDYFWKDLSEYARVNP